MKPHIKRKCLSYLLALRTVCYVKISKNHSGKLNSLLIFAPVRFVNIYPQGMGYLHARGIVHTDLRSKNVFLELNNRVVITDFGLFSVAGLTTKSVRPGMLMIPEGWLPYLAPEILRSLTTQQDAPDSSQFTFATDMYAFG